MTNLTDIGVNLMSPAFDNDRKEVLASAKESGVYPLVIIGNDIASSEQAVNFTKNRREKCYSTVGVHPHNAKNWDTAAAINLMKLISEAANDTGNSNIVAIGECGLDYYRNFSPREAQLKCFEDQLALAAEIGKPVFLHERDAFTEIFSLLNKYHSFLSGVVVHCFSGGTAELEAYLSIDCYIGITGWLCDERRGGHLIPLLKNIPADRLLFETDSPYLIPRNLPRSIKKGGRNEPCFLPHVVSFAAEILNKPFEQLAAETSANAARLFMF